MECLGIPIDHRLRRVIRQASRVDGNKEDSEHIKLLHSFGSSLAVGDSDYPICDLSFGLEMARPESKGGVLIVLRQPHSSQKNRNGFLEGTRTCRTIKAVSELISAVNNAKLGFDEVSVFDATPLLDEKADHQPTIAKAQAVFADMVIAKEPDIILCCFTTDTRDSLVKKLQSIGVGKVFKARESKITEFGLSSTLVNAFHPSYAINYHPIPCCFKRLLVLEFTKAFALWRQIWTEEPALEPLLRAECQIAAQAAKRGGKDIKVRWDKLLTSLDAKLKRCFFQRPQDIEAEDLQCRLVVSKITWISCDIAYILEEQQTFKKTINPERQQELLQKFQTWSHKAWPGGQLRCNQSSSHGYFDHLPLLLLKSNQPSEPAKSLENKLFNLLRDLNLSFERVDSADHGIEHNFLAQACAFRRFAGAFEDILEDIAENNLRLKEAELNNKMGFLSLNETAAV